MLSNNIMNITSPFDGISIVHFESGGWFGEFEMSVSK